MLDVVVVADRGGKRENALHDAGDGTAGRAPSVLFEIESTREGLVDLLQRPGQGRSGQFRLACADRPWQPDALLGRFAFELVLEEISR
ncbi:hypothetical protein AB0D95_07040 [Streptomyces chilikensis]|uniref:Uncharacterized protein n=1 Tax=Streptomyces chilikensis TaxID=1194079 RepID=A0ABV3ELE5_9ACTN